MFTFIFLYKLDSVPFCGKYLWLRFYRSYAYNFLKFLFYTNITLLFHLESSLCLWYVYFLDLIFTLLFKFWVTCINSHISSTAFFSCLLNFSVVILHRIDFLPFFFTVHFSGSSWKRLLTSFYSELDCNHINTKVFLFSQLLPCFYFYFPLHTGF